MSMNQKGLLFTVMIFFIGLTIISANNTLQEARTQAISLQETYLEKVGFRYDNIERQLVDFDKTGYNKTIAQRLLPFDYNLEKDNNYISIKQELPMNSSRIQNVFDFLNLSSIFLSDNNRTNGIFEGLTIDINTISGNWGGIEEPIQFSISPSCYQYKILDTNTTKIAKNISSSCAPANYKRIDINILLNTGDDYNVLFCSQDSCQNTPYSDLNSNPYFSINIDADQCKTTCPNITPKTIQAHFDPTSTFTLTLSCSGINCTSTPITISQKNTDWNFTHAGGRIETINTQIKFNTQLTGFILPDTNISVNSQAEGIKKSN